jgi:hypothetical protein
MLATIRKVLSYLNWISLIAFTATFGIMLYPKNWWGGIIVLVVALFITYVMIEQSSPTYSQANRISGGKPLGNPLVDLGLLFFAIMAYYEASEWHPLIIVGVVSVVIDFLLWLVNVIINIQKAKSGED